MVTFEDPIDSIASRSLTTDTVGGGEADSLVQISTIVYGGHTITDPSVYDRCTDYASTQELFTFSNEFFGGDPFFGSRKWAAIAYQYGDEGPMRFLIGWEGESKILLDAPIPQPPLQAQSSSLRFYMDVYGGKIIDDVDVLQRFVTYVNGHETFTVSNFIFGGDPDFGVRKWCFIAYKRGAEEEEMRYLVGWEGERRRLGGYARGLTTSSENGDEV